MGGVKKRSLKVDTTWPFSLRDLLNDDENSHPSWKLKVFPPTVQLVIARQSTMNSDKLARKTFSDSLKDIKVHLRATLSTCCRSHLGIRFILSPATTKQRSNPIAAVSLLDKLLMRIPRKPIMCNSMLHESSWRLSAHLASAKVQKRIGIYCQPRWRLSFSIFAVPTQQRSALLVAQIDSPDNGWVLTTAIRSHRRFMNHKRSWVQTWCEYCSRR